LNQTDASDVNEEEWVVAAAWEEKLEVPSPVDFDVDPDRPLVACQAPTMGS
jgi:hypothetical protein